MACEDIFSCGIIDRCAWCAEFERQAEEAAAMEKMEQEQDEQAKVLLGNLQQVAMRCPSEFSALVRPVVFGVMRDYVERNP